MAGVGRLLAHISGQFDPQWSIQRQPDPLPRIQRKSAPLPTSIRLIEP